MPQESQEREGQIFRISYDRERDLFIAITGNGARIEVDKDFNTLHSKCQNQGMIFDGISEESDELPPSYYGT